jgi:LuxR family maltose regulon positive regulatory protein
MPTAIAPTPARTGNVARPRLVARLADPHGPPIALVAAPGGYGKTTLLVEWAAQERRPVEWIALSPADDDPALLAAALARALERPAPFALVLDDVHVLRSRGALRVLRTLVDEFPSGSRLVLSSRTEPALPVGRLRAHRVLTEVRAHDLAMDGGEAADLLENAGVRLRPRDVETLVRRTEGWPAALYLAAATLRDESDSAAAADRFGGHDAAVRQYLCDVVLDRMPRSTAAFLLSTSILDRLTGPACDAVLGRTGSAATLDALARTDLLLVPLDRRGDTYRCRRLLSDMLAAELRHRDPRTAAELHRRAAEWYAAQGDPERAVGHAIAAGAHERAGELMWAAAPEYVGKGRNETVGRWLSAFGDSQIAADPLLALTAAESAVARGDLAAAERWEPGAAPGTAALSLRAALASEGLVGMGHSARGAADLAPADSPSRSRSRLLEGVALHLTGDAEGAEQVLEEGARCGAVTAPNAQVLCLAQLALMAADRGDGEGASAFAARARAQVDHYGLGGYPTSALVFAVSAAVRARRDRLDEARDDLRHAVRLLDRLVDYYPWYKAEARVALARAALSLGDLPGARDHIAAASRAARRVPEAVVLHGWIATVDAQADVASAAAVAGSASLTTAELRILRFLPTHLSFREIAARLYVSANTVKTQAHAVYRKLDASSRSQAVARAGELGLLDL